MGDASSHARSWGTNSSKQKPISDGVSGWATKMPQPRQRPLAHRGRWAAGAIFLSAFGVACSFLFPDTMARLLGY